MAGLQDRDQFERNFARRLGGLSGKHRRELLELLGNPPDFGNVPESFWVKVERENEQEMLAMLLLIFIASATSHGSTGEEANRAGITWATTRAAQMASAWVTGARDIFSRVWNRYISATAAGERFPVSAEVSTAFAPTRIERDVITSTTDATSQGAEFSVKSRGLDDSRDRWITEADARVCPICKPLHGTTRETWELKFPTGPPAHERCRCEIGYARSNLLNRAS